MFIYPPFKPYRLLFYSYCFTLILFIFLRAKSYYAIGLYPVFIAFGSVYIEKDSKYRLDKIPKGHYAIIWITVMSVPFIYFTFPIKVPLM